MSTPVSPLLLERYELKYIIPMSLVEPISKYVSHFCEMDYYSKVSSDGFYTINSLYLDTPTLYLLRRKDSANAHRFSMRVRSYGDAPTKPYYFEVKHKLREYVKKKRARINSEDWADILRFGHVPNNIDQSSRAYTEEFVQLAHTYNVSPVALTQYRRRAFLSTIDAYARVTFDRNLRYHEETEYNVLPDDKRLCHYDIPEIFGDRGCHVILELKCEQKIPTWIIDLIREFELTRSSFSKYSSSMLTQLADARGLTDYLEPVYF